MSTSFLQPESGELLSPTQNTFHWGFLSRTLSIRSRLMRFFPNQVRSELLAVRSGVPPAEALALQMSRLSREGSDSRP